MLYLWISIQLRDRNHTSNLNKENSLPRIINQSKGTENPREEEAGTGVASRLRWSTRREYTWKMPALANLRFRPCQRGWLQPSRWSGNLPRCCPSGLAVKLPERAPVRHTEGRASLSLHTALSAHPKEQKQTTKSWSQSDTSRPLPVILSTCYTSWQRANVYRVRRGSQSRRRKVG